MKSNNNCLIAQSGGPTTAINASLAGVIQQALESGEINHILGALNGIQGVLNEEFLNLSELFGSNADILDNLKSTPSMYLGSCRYRLPNITENQSDYKTIFQVLSKHNIKYFFYIGGNDSMDTVAKLSSYANTMDIDVRIVGIPKTIDNDLACIDHTPGYGSSAKYIASSILEIAHDAYIYDTKSVSIVEIMGRNAGWLTAASALARTSYSSAPHLIYLPETPFSTDSFLEDVKEQLNTRNHVIIAVSEGIKDKKGGYVSANTNGIDQFGHVTLSGTGKHLETLVKNKIGCKVRSVELNVLQRCASHISSQTDLDEAFSLGVHATSIALQGQTGVMVTLKRRSNSPYQIEYSFVPIENVANIEKCVPQEWITPEGNDITHELVEYVTPLIQGEVAVNYSGGIPSYLPVEHLYERV
ncbi:MAG TPA: 6-phosphofructokinase [Lachnospiraceae bacterium]|nr:6-phosphofructokinase [Lachnospiraceae bacterium]